MKKRRKLYDIAKQLNTEEAWVAYRKLHNKVNKMLETAHEEYRTRILDTAFSDHQRQFWKYNYTSYEEEHILYTNTHSQWLHIN